MWLSRLSVQRPVLMSMVVGLFVVFGLVAWPRMPVELLPDVEVPYLFVSAAYPGAGPEDVEASVLLPLEDALGEVNNLASLYSGAVPDGGRLVLELEPGSDVELAVAEVRGVLEEVERELPPGVWRPTVKPINLGAAPVLQLAVTGQRPLPELTEWVEDELVEALSRVEGVSTVDLVGHRTREVQVEVDQARLLAHHLTLGHLAEALRAGGVDVPAGALSVSGRSVPVRTHGSFSQLSELEEVVIQAPLGELVPLTAVADVRESVAPESTRARFHGRPAIGVSVFKRADANTVALGRDLTPVVEEIEASAPKDLQLHLVQDASVAIRVSVRSLVATMGLCVLLTAGILWFFLHDWRGTAIVAVSIPASMVGSLVFVYLSGFSVNYMTLMGLAITVGVLVDASIVVLESIAREARTEPDAKVAADKGTGRVFLGVVGSTVTNIAVFTPMAFMQGIVGQFFVPFALTITYSMVLSLLMSFTLTPMLASFLYRRMAGRERPAPGWVGRAWDRGYGVVEGWFRGAIHWSLGHRLLSLSAVSVVFLSALCLLGPLTSLGWFTNPDQGFFIVRLTLPQGTDLDRTAQAVRRAEELLYAHEEVSAVFAEVGRYGTLFGPLESRSRAELQVVLVPREGQRTSEFMDEVRSELAVAVPGAALLVKELGGGEMAIRDDFLVDVYGPDPQVLDRLGAAVVEAFEAQPNVSDVTLDGLQTSPQLTVRPHRARLAQAGLTTADLGLLLRVAVHGDDQARLRADGEEIPIRLRLRQRDRADAASVGATTIQTASGAQVALRELAEVSEEQAPTSISRRDHHRQISVRANLAWGAVGDTAARVAELLESEEVPEGTTLRIGGEEQQRSEASAELGAAMVLAMVLIYMLLAGLLESFWHPLTILSAVPLALVGVLVSLAASGVALDIFGLMAVVMLLGIVVNNGILMIEAARQELAGGLPLREALEVGAMRRLRPILMTSLSTVVGMIPLALALGPGAELRQSMALVSIGGVAVSSVLIVVICPVLYSLVEDARQVLGLRRRAR